jgi:predicted DNA-binding transcriptional regulator YafY
MTFDNSPLLKVLKTLFGWSGSGPAPGTLLSKPAIKLHRPVIVSAEVPNAIRTWRSAFRLPFARPRTRTEQRAHDAIRDHQPLTFVYYGGSDAGNLRTVDPIILFRVEGFDGAYLIAYCRLRQEFRTFRVARMGLSEP